MLCASVFVDMGRVYVRGQVCVCVPFDWLENRLHFDTSSFEKTENMCSICSRICIRAHTYVYTCNVCVCVLVRKRTFDWLDDLKLSSFDGFTFSRACTFY